MFQIFTKTDTWVHNYFFVMNVFYIFFTPPIHFNDQSLEVLRESSANDQLITIENSYNDLIFERKNLTLSYTEEENATKTI